jgi:hypothetical protein
MLPPSAQGETQSTVTQAQLKRERLKFVDFQLRRPTVQLCVAQVELEWLDGARIVGRAEGQPSQQAELRVAAQAALDALERFAEGALRFELIGVKAMRAFDANIVIVSVDVRRPDGTTRLLGSYLAEQDIARAAVMATLNATNRVLGNFIATR